MPVLDPSKPIVKTSELTKSLRSRDKAIIELLPAARDLFEGAQNTYFPHRNEWLLEWLVQRVKEEDNCTGRAAPETWRLLFDLLGAVEDANIVAGILKRHSVVAGIARALGELRITLEGMSITANELGVIADVLERLKEMARKNSSVMVAVRAPIEASAAILGDFFGICEVLLVGGQNVEESWVENMMWLWSSSVWGSSNTKRISTVWSEKCLQAASSLLMTVNVPSLLQTNIESMISEYIFAPDVLQPPQPPNAKTPSKPLFKELLPLLSPLRPEDTQMSGTSDASSSPSRLHLPVIFKIALKTLQRRQHSKPDPELVEIIFKALLSSILNIDFSTHSTVSAEAAENITSLLDCMTELEIPLPLSSLVDIVSKVADLDTEPRWSIVEATLKNDFDTFLHPTSSVLANNLFRALDKATPDEQIFRVIDLLISGFAKARDLLGFVEHWKQGLPHKIWTTNSVKRAFAKHIETSLIPTQVERLAKELGEQKQWHILDATLRGIRKEGTEDRLISAGILKPIVEEAVKEKDSCAWRIVVRISGIEPSAIHDATEQARKIVKKSKVDKQEIATLAAEVILRDTESSDAYNSAAVATLLKAAAEAWTDGKDIFARDVNAAIVGRFLPLLETAGAELRNQVVDCMLSKAKDKSGDDARQIWLSLVKNDELYELTGLKDAVVSALLSATQKKEFAKSVVLIFDSFMAFPAEAIRKTHKEQILDICLAMDVSGDSPVSRPLMRKLWRVGTANVKVFQSADNFRKLFRAPENVETGRRILKYAVNIKDREKIKTFLSDVVKAVSTASTKGKKISSEDLRFCWVVIGELWVSLGEELNEARKDILKILERSIKDLAPGKANILEMWRSVWALNRDDLEGGLKVAGLVTKYLVSMKPALSGDAEVVIEGVSLIFEVSDTTEAAIAAASLAVVALENLDDSLHQRILTPYRGLLTRLDAPSHAMVLQAVATGCLDGELPDAAWELLKVAVDTIPAPTTTSNGASSSSSSSSSSHDAITAISHFHTLLALRLPITTSPTAALSILSSLSSLLRNHQWSVTQHMVDTTLSAISILVSPSGPTFSPPLPPCTPTSSSSTLTSESLYLALLSPLSAILSLHRHRIRNRYHLFIPLLSQLLTSLYLPRLARKRSERSLHAPWLLQPLTLKTTTTASSSSSSSSAAETPQHLSIPSARAFSRILQTLCEPPASTVRSHHRTTSRDHLESEIRKEKRLVAKAVGPLLEMQVKRVLEERMETGMRKEVMVGIGHVLEVLGREGMARVGDRLSVEGRAVVRGIWKEMGVGGRERV